MRLNAKTSRLITPALAAAAALLALAPAALAGGHGNGHGRGHAYGHRGYDRGGYRVVYRSRPVVYAAPPVAYHECAPRYVVYRPSRVVIVRPTPYVRIGTHIGPVDISAILGPKRYASRYEYGCNFCDAHFGSFGGYENHVEHCAYRPANVRIEVHAWGDNGYGDNRGYDDNQGYDDQGYDDQNYDDQGYDDQYDGR